MVGCDIPNDKGRGYKPRPASVYPQHRRIKARNVRNFEHKLQDRWQAFCAGTISFAEFDSSVQGWINHVRYADSWGLRKHVLGKPLVPNQSGPD